MWNRSEIKIKKLDMKNIENKIWCVLRPNYKDGNLINVGILGTGFFISKNNFITAYHLLNEECLKANNQYNNDCLILKNLSGKEIVIKEDCNINYYPKKDITNIIFKEDFDFLNLEYKSEESENVINFGFPSDDINDLMNVDKDKNLNLNKIINQEGKILKNDENFSIKRNDINIKNKKVIVVDYSSKIGFSGGPLINNSGKVIGMMSMIVPSEYGDLSNKALAISAKEF